MPSLCPLTLVQRALQRRPGRETANPPLRNDPKARERLKRRAAGTRSHHAGADAATEETKGVTMAEQTKGTQQEQQGGEGQAQGRLQGAMPLVVGIAAAAAAGAVAIVARRALSGDEAPRPSGGDGGKEERDPTSFQDLDQVAADLSGLVDELRSTAAAEGERDFDQLVKITDAISEYADQAAAAFHAAASDSDRETSGRVTDDLMNRVQALTEEVRERVGVGSQRAADTDS